MKFKATRNDFTNQRVIQVKAYTLQYLLRYENPIAYNESVVGWDWDMYEVENTYICTGSRNLIGIKADDKIVKRYEDKARAISYSNLSYEEQKETLKKLQKEFIKEVHV